MTFFIFFVICPYLHTANPPSNREKTMSNQELAAAIRELATKLDQREASWTDVLFAVGQRMQAVTGAPHLESDPKVQEALTTLARAVVLAAAAEGGLDAVIRKMMFALGYGVSEGKYGTDFFRQLAEK